MSELEELRAENARLAQRNLELEQTLATRPIMARGALLSLIHDVPMLVGVAGADGDNAYLNHAFERWTDPAAAGGRVPGRLIAPLRDRLAALLPKVLAGETEKFVASMPDVDGRWRDVMLTISPRLGLEDEVNGFILVGQDTTDRRHADEALVASERRLTLAMEAADLGIWDWNLLSDEIVYSDRGLQIYGLAPGQPVSVEQVRARTHPDDRARNAAMRARAKDAAIRAREPLNYRLKLPDGEVRWVLAHGETIFDTIDGVERAVRYIGTLQDITERRKVETALEDSNTRLQLIIDGGGVGIFDTDLSTGKATWSGSTFSMMGMRAPGDGHANIGLWQQRLHPEDAARVVSEHGEAVARGGGWQTSYRILRADTGEVRWLQIYGRILGHGAPNQDVPNQNWVASRSVGMVVDVTDEKQAESRQRLLLNELNHRVKNTLATVQSIARTTLRALPGGEAATDLFTARLLALSAAHDVLTREAWEGAGLGEIVAGAVKAHQNDGQPRFDVQGKDVRVGPRAAVALALALHELATNAAKYGALSNDDGRVILRWEARGEGAARRLELEWREIGGPAVTPPTRMGFGSRILGRGLQAELGAKALLQFEPGGLVCVIHAGLLDESAAPG
jgi:two-component sensor histidine kinase